MTGRPLIARGERAPDFALPRGVDDAPCRFYGVAGGTPVALLVGGGDDLGLIAEVAGKLRADDGDPVDVHVVLREPAGAIDAAFHDTDGRVHGAYGVEPDTSVAVVLDANLRVLATIRIGDADSVREAIFEAVSSQPAHHDDAARHVAPVLFVPDALSATMCADLIERWETEGAVETGVETAVQGKRAEVTDVRRKRRRDHTVVDRQLLRTLTQHVGARVFPELQKAFAFRAGGFEGFKIGCYAAQDRGYFEAHRDNLSASTTHRRFGLTLNLNDDYVGGELRFPEYGPASYRPAAGEALVFSGSHLHEVQPVERGRRFVLLSFILAGS